MDRHKCMKSTIVARVWALVCEDCGYPIAQCDKCNTEFNCGDEIDCTDNDIRDHLCKECA